MGEVKYKLDLQGYFEYGDDQYHHAIYKLNDKGKYDYLFIVKNKEEGETYLNNPHLIERRYRNEKILIYTMIGLTICLLGYPLIHFILS